MLVVADQHSLWISRQRRLAGPGQTEQQRRTARLLVGGGRTMHGQDTMLRAKVIHHRKDALLHLTSVLRP